MNEPVLVIDPCEVAHMLTILNNTHESVYRAFGLLRMVKALLQCDVPAGVVLQLIAVVEAQGPIQTPS